MRCLRILLDFTAGTSKTNYKESTRLTFASFSLLSPQESLQQQHLAGVIAQTATGTGTPASLATPPTTVHPVRQSSIAAPQHLKSQRSINTPATATPPKVRPQSRNLLLDSSDMNFSGSQPKQRQSQQQPQQQQQQQQQDAQLSVTDSPAPGLPYQTSSAKENQGPAAAAEGSTDTPTKNTKKSAQGQLQPPQQHLLKPNKQVCTTILTGFSKNGRVLKRHHYNPIHTSLTDLRNYMIMEHCQSTYRPLM